MRWWDKEIGRPYGTYRWVTKFLLTPLEIRGETRWMETATWFEEWTRGQYGDFWQKIYWKGNPPKKGDKDDYYLSTCQYLKDMQKVRETVDMIEWERGSRVKSSGMD